MPLSLVIDQQFENKYCPVLTMSMGGQILGSDEQGHPIPISMEEALSGKFLVLFCQPEGTATDPGQKFLRNLARGDHICGLFVDEVHQGLDGHWESIRPLLLKNILNTKVYMSRGAPICIMTATITLEELTKVIGMIGRKKEPLLVAAGPILSHTKICCVRRPSSSVHLLGRTKADGSHQPGDLAYLRTIVLDDFIRTVQHGMMPYTGFPRTIVFFR